MIISSTATQLALLLADDDTDGGESKKSGPLGIVVIIVLCVACYFLFKSMSKHLRRVREGSVGGPTPPVDGRPPVIGPDGPDGPGGPNDAAAPGEPDAAPDEPLVQKAAPPPS